MKMENKQSIITMVAFLVFMTTLFAGEISAKGPSRSTLPQWEDQGGGITPGHGGIQSENPDKIKSKSRKRR